MPTAGHWTRLLPCSTSALFVAHDAGAAGQDSANSPWFLRPGPKALLSPGDWEVEDHGEEHEEEADSEDHAIVAGDRSLGGGRTGGDRGRGAGGAGESCEVARHLEDVCKSCVSVSAVGSSLRLSNVPMVPSK